MKSSVPRSSHLGYHLVGLFFGLLALSGCGAEVAATTATVGAMQATQAKQAQLQQAKVVDGFKAAQEAGAARAATASD